MKTFFKAQLSSLIATTVDFIVMILFVEFIHLHYSLAVVIGAIGGALTNFLINRNWSFEVRNKAIAKQSIKYLFVWLGSVLLNVLGVYALVGFFKMSYLLSKVTVSICVGLFFNYGLQRKYVFNPK